MHRYTLALTSLLLLAAGCRHSNLPSLPASHGQLSLDLDRYVREEPEPRSGDYFRSTFHVLFSDETPLTVEPGQARAVFEEAVAVLKGQPSAGQVRQAADDLKAACEAGLAEACGFLRERYVKPVRLTGGIDAYTPEALRHRVGGTLVIQCRLGVEGQLHGCEPREGLPHGITEAALESAARTRWQPAMLAGHPIEIPYSLVMTFKHESQRFTHVPLEARLQTARARAAKSPRSPAAWAELATVLARHSPEDPWYADSLRYLTALDPGYWWAANELAWLYVQQGQAAEAAPLAKRARALASENPYVLETSAAVLAATGQCEQALQQQRQAVERLPAEWPAPERERFAHTLREYQRKCATQP